MARDGQAAQDAELNRMDKINRQNPDDRKPKNITLKEQLEEEARLARMTPGQRAAELPWGDWERNLRDHLLYSKELTVTSRIYNIVLTRHRKEIEDMKNSGISYKAVANWISTKSEDYTGWVR